MKIHFIGIGGIGVSALAHYYLAQGHQVSGSDLVASEIIRALKKKGAKIRIGPHLTRKLLARFDLVVYSPAVRNIKSSAHIKSYPEALGELTKHYLTIAVSGTHGKSTTATMVSLILIKAGFDPTVLVGTKVKEFGNSNCRVGKSKYLVIEADEHFASFLNYWPKIIVLTNIEADHLDYYKNFQNIKKAFKKFISHLPKDGHLVKPFFEKKIKKILKVPGDHNIYNASCALAVARILGIPDKISFKALSEYQGAWRRFDLRKKKHLTIVSDYGHHPTEIKATLKAAKDKWPNKKIWCVFQPHQYQRTHYLFHGFVKAFARAPVDKIIVTDIFDVAGRENERLKKRVNSEKLVRAIKNPKVSYLPKDKIINYLKNNLWGHEVVIFMGAGDIYEVDKKFN